MSDTSVYVNTSKIRRPDTVTLDYQTCFTLGPAVQGDASQGIISYAWRVRHDANLLKIYVARENETRDGWLDETELFNYSGNPFVEIDAAFDQAGRIFVCGERDGSVWAYFFNSTLPGFGLFDLGAGRTPRCILDNPRDPSDSDILLFYMDDENDVMAYRQQRDRYEIAYLDTGVTNVSTKYVEDATRTKTNRVQIYYSERNTSTGRYALKILLTALYPYTSDSDDFTGQHEFLDGGTLITVVITDDLEVETITASHDFLPGSLLYELIIQHVLYDKDAYTADHEFLSGGTLLDLIIQHVLYDKDALSASHDFLSGGTLVVVVITHTLYDKDAYSADHSFQSGGTLA